MTSPTPSSNSAPNPDSPGPASCGPASPGPVSYGADTNEDTQFVLQGIPEPTDENGYRSREPFEILASQYSEELRLGLRPSIELYARRYPPHAERIREFFPVLEMLESVRAENESTAFRQNMPETFPFSTIGGCELLCELGRGGMGIVFQARDTASSHIVAVKILPWRVALAPEWRRRFEHEAQIAARLRHRNIVPVFRFGIDQGYCYYVMQFVNGVSLAEIIQRLRQTEGVVYQDEILRTQNARPAGFVRSGQFATTAAHEMPVDNDPLKRRRLTKHAWNSLARIAVQITQAVRAAHLDSIVHNDIKPGNVLLDHDGRVWVADFGLSQVIPQAAHGSRLYRIPGHPLAGRHPLATNDSEAAAVQLAGTLRYMAPERLLGLSDPRSDLYSLGMTLYELTTLQPAFQADNTDEMIRLILETEPRSPRSLVPEIPADLETIILNCIAHAPDERYQNADALLSDLLLFGNGARVNSTRRKSFTSFFKQISERIRGKSPDSPPGQEST